MYMSVRRYEGVPDPREAARQVQASFVPIISQVPGFVSYHWIDAGGGVMVSTSIFEDQAGAEESNRRAAAWVKEHPDLLAKPVMITAGEVVARKVAGPGPALKVQMLEADPAGERAGPRPG